MKNYSIIKILTNIWLICESKGWHLKKESWLNHPLQTFFVHLTFEQVQGNREVMEKWVRISFDSLTSPNLLLGSAKYGNKAVMPLADSS